MRGEKEKKKRKRLRCGSMVAFVDVEWARRTSERPYTSTWFGTSLGGFECSDKVRGYLMYPGG